MENRSNLWHLDGEKMFKFYRSISLEYCAACILALVISGAMNLSNAINKSILLIVLGALLILVNVYMYDSRKNAYKYTFSQFIANTVIVCLLTFVAYKFSGIDEFNIALVIGIFFKLIKR